jgi:hypothetical protein
MVPRALRFAMNPATLEKGYMQSLSDEPHEEFGGPRVRYNN